MCRTLDSGESWHTKDYAIDCNGSTHQVFVIIAAIGMVVYPLGIPGEYPPEH